MHAHMICRDRVCFHLRLLLGCKRRGGAAALMMMMMRAGGLLLVKTNTETQFRI